MAKPIKLTQEIVEKIAAEFVSAVQDMKLSDGKITYTKSFSYDGDNVHATILFEPVAYAKMLLLLDRFESEVAWHGTVDRVAEDCFVVKDIFVYPQEVSGSTVNTDQEGYTKWLISLDDDTANHLHMQGHSHVRMGTSPSSVDLNHQSMILDQITGDDFYIFMIFNKRLEHTIKIYDFKSNTLFEDADISIGIVGDGEDLETFVKDAKESVKSRTFTTVSASSGTSTYGGSAYCGNAYGSGSSYSGTYSGSGYSGATAQVSQVPAATTSAKSSTVAGGKKNKDDGSKKKRGRPPKGQIGFASANEDEDTDYDAYIFGSRRKYS